ncbi:MAG: carbon-nitrogen hydrolase family protein [Candidatus Tectomicrobia bacterium]|nr:carbon-nitrogen hydrolase family protein [Candidatus Tectomicrobia bacterium]
MATVRVASAQFYSGDDTEENLKLCQDFIERAAAGGAQLVVLPENSNRNRSYANPAECYQHAVTLPGPFFDPIIEQVRRLKMYLVINTDLRGSRAPEVFITSVLIGPKGVIGRHRKHILWDYEYTLFVPGEEECQVFDTELGRIGMQICGDGILPETPRCLALLGAQMLCNSLNSRGPDEKRLHIPCRAIENRCWHISSNSVGNPLPEVPWTGGSQVVAPDGSVLVCASETEPDLVFADIEPELADDKRCAVTDHIFAWRRPDLYRILEEPVESLPAAPFYGKLADDDRPAPVRAAAMQLSLYHDYGYTLRRAEGQIAYAGFRGAQLGVLPQLFPFAPDEPQRDAAGCARKSWDILPRLQGKVREVGIWLATSLVEEENGSFFHTAYLLSPRGEIAGRYRKTHLNSGEQRWASAGDDLPVFQTEIGILGIIIGDEIWVPEVARCLALKGCEIYLHPCSWATEQEARILAVQRVEENKVHLVSANRLDSPAPCGSQIVMPDLPFPGQPIALQRYPMAYMSRYGFEEELILDLDRRVTHSKLMGFHLDCLKKRMPHIYHVMCAEQTAPVAR